MPDYLLPSEQWGAWKERNIHLPRRIKKNANRNAALADAELTGYLKTHFCTKPFDTMETLDQGSVNICCPDWLPTPIGGIDDLPGAWAGRTVRKVRESIIDGSFKYCSHLDCSWIANRSLMPRDSAAAQALIARFEADGTAPPPRELKLSHDRSCNLSCPSCRTDLIVAGKAKQQRLDDQLEKSFVPMLRDATSVYITGSGDPFGSAHFRRLIKRLNRAEFPEAALPPAHERATDGRARLARSGPGGPRRDGPRLDRRGGGRHLRGRPPPGQFPATVERISTSSGACARRASSSGSRSPWSCRR